MEVVEGQVQVLQGAIVGKDIDDLVHLVATQSIPTDIQLLQVPRAFNQRHQFLVVRMIQVDVDQTETPDIIFGLIECEKQVIGDLC